MTEEGRGNLPVPAGDRRVAPQAARRFRDEEAADILRRASTREVRSNLPSPHDPTLEDLVAVAEEVGLDGGAVRRAAAIRPLPDSSAQAWVFGGQASRTVRGAIDGPLPTDRAALARTAEATTGRSGSVVKSEPGSWIWESKGGLGHTRVVLKEDAGSTDLTVRGSRADILALTYLPLLVGVGAISGGLGLFATVTATMGPLAALIGLFGLPLLLTRPLFARFDGRMRDRLEDLSMELIRAAEEDRGGADDTGDITD